MKYWEVFFFFIYLVRIKYMREFNSSVLKIDQWSLFSLSPCINLRIDELKNKMSLKFQIKKIRYI